MLNYITWDVSPFIYEGEHFAIGWYGTLATISSAALLLIYLLLFKNDKLPISYAFILFLATTILTYLFGHIIHCLFYEWYYSEEGISFLGTTVHWTNPSFQHPGRLLNLSHGGFASHGCVLGGIFTALILKKYMNCGFYWLFDRIMIGSCCMLFIRIGNLINAEIYGISTSMPWGFIFEEGASPVHPTQLYEIMYFLVAFGVGFWMIMKTKARDYNGLISGAMLLLIFIPRFFIEFIKNPQGDFENGWVINMGQILSIPYIIWGIGLVYKSLREGSFEKITPRVKCNHKERKKLKKK